MGAQGAPSHRQGRVLAMQVTFPAKGTEGQDFGERGGNSIHQAGTAVSSKERELGAKER